MGENDCGQAIARAVSRVVARAAEDTRIVEVGVSSVPVDHQFPTGGETEELRGTGDQEAETDVPQSAARLRPAAPPPVHRGKHEQEQQRCAGNDQFGDQQQGQADARAPQSATHR